MRKKRLAITNSEFKKEIKAFVKGGGRVLKLPDEIEWDMFPYNDNHSMEKEKNEKGILDYEANCKFIRGEILQNGGR